MVKLSDYLTPGLLDFESGNSPIHSSPFDHSFFSLSFVPNSLFFFGKVNLGLHCDNQCFLLFASSRQLSNIMQFPMDISVLDTGKYRKLVLTGEIRLSCHVSPDADVSLTSGTRSPDETDGAAGSVTQSIFVRFTSNFVHLHPLQVPPPPRKGSCLRKGHVKREMQRKQGLEESERERERQKIHTTAPEHLTDDKLLLSTLCAEFLARKHSGGWDNDRSGVAPEAPGYLSKLPVSPRINRPEPAK